MLRSTLRSWSPRVLLCLAAAAATGCSSSKSPTAAAIERGDALARADEQRLAPHAAKRQGLLIAGDGFGRMAYTSDTPIATASADDQ